MNRGSSKINPNGHIPALDDEDEAGNKVTLFESTSMLLYLVGKYDKDHKVSYPYGSPEYWKTVNWVSSPQGPASALEAEHDMMNCS